MMLHNVKVLEWNSHTTLEYTEMKIEYQLRGSNIDQNRTKGKNINVILEKVFLSILKRICVTKICATHYSLCLVKKKVKK